MVQISLQNSGGKEVFLRGFHGTPLGHQWEWKYLGHLRVYSTPWALFLETLCIFSKNKATLDKVYYGSGQKCSKELKNHSFTSVETTVVKL